MENDIKKKRIIWKKIKLEYVPAMCVFLNVYISVTMCKCTTKRYKPFSCSLIMFVLFCLIMVFKIGYVCVYVYVYVYVSVCVYVCVNECVYV